jgi:hypothetical protein
VIQINKACERREGGIPMGKEGETRKEVRVGPTITDTLNTQKIVKFLNENSELIAWLGGKMKTAQGRRELTRLFCVELKRR